MKILKSFNELMTFFEKELGIKKGDTINIISSPIDREYEVTIKFYPQTKEELQAIIDTAPRAILKKMGVRVWTDYNDSKRRKEKPAGYLKPNMVHYLFAKEWYRHLPNGIKVIDISGRQEVFKRDISDDDTRYGCLPYGFIRIEK